MDTRRIHITGKASNRLLRMARDGKVVTAIPAPNEQVTELSNDIRSMDDLGIADFSDLLDVTPRNPLELLVPDEPSRRWSDNNKNGIRTSFLSVTLPDGAFLELKEGADEQQALRIPSNLRVFIESPALALVQGAKVFTRAIGSHGANKLVALLRLLEFADECCGWYSRDPANPRTGKILYDDPKKWTRFSNPTQIRAFLDNANWLIGLRLARQVAGHIIDGSGSPMESYINHALTLVPRYGGLSMCTPLANQQLVLSNRQRTLITHDSLRPDLQWPEYHMLAEYLGDKDHASKAARVEDKNRLLDYAKTSYTAYPLMFDDVRNAEALNRTAQMLAREFMARGARGELYRIRKLIKNENFIARQRTLLATLLPPIAHYEDAPSS